MVHTLERQPNNPRYVLADALDGAKVTTRKELDAAIDYKDAYVIGERFTLADASTKEFLLSNPSGSGVKTHIPSTRVSAGGQNLVDVNYNSTVDTSGDTVTPKNVVIDGSNDSVTDVEVDGSYTVNDDDPFEVFNAGGSATPSRIGSPGQTDTFDVEAGNNIHFVIENDSGSEVLFSFFLLFWEEEP